MNLSESEAHELFDREKKRQQKLTAKRRQIRDLLGEEKAKIYLQAISQLIDCEADVIDVLALAAFCREIKSKKENK